MSSDLSLLRRGDTTSIRRRCGLTVARLIEHDRRRFRGRYSAPLPPMIGREHSRPRLLVCMVVRLEDARFLPDSACVNCATSAAPRRHHIGCTCPIKRRRTKVWHYCGDRRPGGVLWSRTTRGRPRRMTAILRRDRPTTSTVSEMAPEARSA